MGIEERRPRGEELLEKMLGSDQAARIRENWRKISPEFEEYVVEFLSGEIWSREGLDLPNQEPGHDCHAGGNGPHAGVGVEHTHGPA